MPPLEAKKMLFRRVAADGGWRRRRGMPPEKLLFIDVRKAHLNAICEEEEWVELPEEFWQWGRCARLRRWLYGMRPAAAGWEDDYTRRLESVGFKRGMAAPMVFYNAETEVRVVVHGAGRTCSMRRRSCVRAWRCRRGWGRRRSRGRLGISLAHPGWCGGLGKWTTTSSRRISRCSSTLIGQGRGTVSLPVAAWCSLEAWR